MQQPSTGSAGQSGTSQYTTGQSGGTTEELKSDAKQLGSTAADRIHSEVDNRKGEAVSQAQSLTSAIRQTADGLDDNAPQWLRSAFQQGADQLQRFAESIENKDSRQILNDVQSFARERPALFLGAAAAAGFAAARIFKAGSEQQNSQRFTSDYDRSQPWGSGDLGSENEDWGRGDTFGQQFDESSTGSQSSTLGGIGGGSSQAFMARPETQSPTSSQFEQSRMEDDPLVLGTRDTPVMPDGGAR